LKDENEIGNQTYIDENNDDDDLDTFILDKFKQFSGKQNVVQWLDDADNEFTYFCIGRNLRFAAISLLVEGDAKRKYIKNRNAIRSFDDFYEFFLLSFEPSSGTSCSFKSLQTVSNLSTNLTESYQTKLTIEPYQIISPETKMLNVTDLTPMFGSTTIVNPGATKSVGVKPGMNTTTFI
jgi:hypothetical protein